MSFLIPEVLAAGSDAAAAPGGNPYSFMIMMVGLVAVFYFLVIRPQSKRAKEHRELVMALSKGDEVVTLGGVLGTVSKLTDQYVILQVSEGVSIPFKREAISQVLIKGTIKAI
jgi:preprotein translocase subunit YajC